jgi:hypothetical protein
MEKKAHGNTKHARLFACIDGVTDDAWMLCGGPEIDDALAGLSRLVKDSVAHAMKHAKLGEKPPAIQLRVCLMTDQEVINLEPA